MTNRSVREQLLAFHGVEDVSQLSEEKQEEVKAQVLQESKIKVDPYGVVSRAWKALQEARKARQIENVIVRASTSA